MTKNEKKTTKKEKKLIHLQRETDEADRHSFYTVSTKVNSALSKYSSIAKEAIHKGSKIHGITDNPGSDKETHNFEVPGETCKRPSKRLKPLL